MHAFIMPNGYFISEDAQLCTLFLSKLLLCMLVRCFDVQHNMSSVDLSSAPACVAGSGESANFFSTASYKAMPAIDSLTALLR